MKLRYFSLLPLVLVGCTSNRGAIKPNKVVEQDVFYDVSYYFDYNTHLYMIYSDDDYQNKVGECPTSRVYFVRSYIELPKNGIFEIENEYFVTTNELYVYTTK